MAKIPINIKEGTIKKESDVIIGIDLGTTNSLVAYGVDGKIEVIKDEDDKNALVPSVIYFDKDNQTIVGTQAKNKLVTDPSRTIFSVKRLMGRSYKDLKDADRSLAYEIIDEDEDKLVRVKIDDKHYTPIELSAEILKSLKLRIESIIKETVTKAVITVPAYFNDTQRQATKDACKLAGLNVLRVVNEPTAASLAYGLNQKSDEAIKIAVYDLGGGTFDISILMIEDGVFEVLSTNGNTYLGGDDFDKAIIDYWSSEYKLKSALDESPSARNLIRKYAEEAKIRLGTFESYEKEIELDEATISLGLSKDKFELLIDPIISKTLEHCKQAMEDAALSKDDLDEIVLVGGSTRTPLVKKKVKAFFERPINDHLNPDEVVAIGAAVQAEILAGNRSNMLLLDITPLSLGIETVGGLMDVIIPRNNKIPTKVGRKYTTSVDGQKNLKVAVFQGERDLVEHNRKLGEFILQDIPPMPAGIPQIEIHFLVDADGILIVRAQELRSGTETKIQIKSQYGISEEEMARMLIDSIKNAESDIKTRSLKEAINEADNISLASKKFVKQNASWLKKDQVEKIIKLEQSMSKAVLAKDLDQIRSAMDALNLYTTPLAHEALDRNIGESLKGTNL